MNFVAEALNLSISAAKRLEERNILRRAFVKHPFFPDIVDAFRLDKKFGYYEDGTVIVKTKYELRVFRGFPKIRRALVLNPTIKKHFGDRKIALEEKMNGYNVRIVKIGDNLYGLTRRGIICPYTTEKIRMIFDDEFFSSYPDYMLCCEAVGPSSPYVPSGIYDTDDLDFYLFDIRECKTNKPVSIDEKIEIAEKYGLKMVKIFKIISPDDFESIKEVVNLLNSEGREGIVFKDVKMMLDPLKYTTHSANTSDLRYAFRYFGEYARDFMLARIVREAFQSFEFEESDEEFEKRCLQLGRAILEPMISSIKACSHGETIYDESELVFYSNEVLDLFQQHLRLLGVDFKIEYVGRDDDKIRVRFKRIMRSTNDKIRGILGGSTWK